MIETLEFTGLEPAQEKAVLALLTNPTIRDAARAAGVGEATLYRWLQIPEFRDAYRAARRQVVSHATARLQNAATLAVAALERNLECGNPATEVRAAVAILEHSIRAIEIEDLAARVEALERLSADEGRGRFGWD